MTGILTALEIEYAAASVGAACNYQNQIESSYNIYINEKFATNSSSNKVNLGYV